MTYRIKVPPKPSTVDEAHLLSTMERLWLAAEEHRRGLLAGVLVVFLAAAVLGGVVWYDAQQAQRAMDLHLEAMRFFATQPQDKPEQAQKNLKKAIALYRDVVQQYPRTQAAAQSLFRLGLALEQDNKLAEAIEAYQKFVNNYGDNDALLGLVYQRLGYAYLRQGETELAQQALASVLAVPGANNKDHALFELAKLAEAQTQPEAALVHYQDLMDRFPTSPFANEVSVRLKALQAKQEPQGEKVPGGEGSSPSEAGSESKTETKE